MAPLANPFDLLDEDSSDLISIVDANEVDAFVAAAERKRLEEEKKAEREAKIKAREEEEKAAREAQKRAALEKKAHEASLLRFRSARPTPSFTRPSAPANDGELAKDLSGLQLQPKEGQAAGDVEQKAVSVDGSSISSEGRRGNVNGSFRRKLKKNKKAEGEKKEGEDQQENQRSQNAAPVGFSNYPRKYTLKEYEEGKHKQANPIDQSQQRSNNGEPRRSNNGEPRRSNNGEPRRSNNGAPRRSNNGEPRRSNNGEPRRSNNGEPRRSNNGAPRRSNNGEPRRSNNGEPRRSNNGEPRRFNNEGQRRFDNGRQRFGTQQAPVEAAVVEPEFSLEIADFPVVGTPVPVVKAPTTAVGKQVPVVRAPTKVVGKAVAKKA